LGCTIGPNLWGSEVTLDAAQGRKVTLSYLVMKELRNDGYRIKDEDFVEDGRRLR